MYYTGKMIRHSAGGSVDQQERRSRRPHKQHRECETDWGQPWKGKTQGRGRGREGEPRTIL